MSSPSIVGNKTEQAQCEAHAINEAIALKLLHKISPISAHKPYASEPMLKSVSTIPVERLAALEGILCPENC